MTRQNLNALTMLADAIAADTERMNWKLDRNADGSWPAINADENNHDERRVNVSAKVMCDMILGSLHRALHGYKNRDGIHKPGLHGRTVEILAKINALLDTDRDGASIDAQMINLDRWLTTTNDMIAAAQAVFDEVESIYLDACCGTETKWKPYVADAAAATNAAASMDKAERKIEADKLRAKYRRA